MATSDLLFSIGVVLDQAVKPTIQQFKNEISQVGVSAKKLGQNFKVSGQETDKIIKAGSQGAKVIRKSFEEAAQKTQVFENSLKQARQSLDGLISSSTKIAALGAGILAGFAFPVKKAADFERTMAKVRAISGATAEEFKALSDRAKELGSSTEFTATEAAEGLVFLSQAGLTANESIDALEGALQLAQVGSISLAQAADFATNVLAGLGLEVDQLGRVNDNLAFAAANANTNVTELSDALKVAGPAAKGSGIEIEEIVAVLGGLANAGVKGSEAGNAVKRLLIDLQKPGGKATKTLNDLGISVHDASGRFRGLLPILVEMGEKNINLAKANEAFGKFTAAAAIAASGQAKSMIELRDGLDSAQGTAQKMAEVMRKNLIGQFKALFSAVESLLIAIGENLLGDLGQLIERFTQGVVAVKDFVTENKNLVKIVTVLAGSLGALLFVLGSVGLSVGLFTKGILGLAGAFQAIQAGAFASSLASIGTVLKFNAAAAAASIGTFTLLAAAVGASVFAFSELFSAIDRLIEARKTLNQVNQINQDLDRKKILLLVDLNKKYGTTFKTLEDFNQAIMNGTLDLKESKKEIEALTPIVGSLEDALRVQNAFEGLKEGRKFVALTKNEIAAFLESTSKAFEVANRSIEEFARKVKDTENQIALSRINTEDRIRNIQRKGLSEESQFNDRRLEAEKKLSDARRAFAEGDVQIASKLAQNASRLFEGLAVEITKTDADGKKIIVKKLEDTKKIAIDGLREVERFNQKILQSSLEIEQENLKRAKSQAEEIKGAFDFLNNLEANIKINKDIKFLEEVRKTIDDLTRERTLVINVKKRVTTEESEGFSSGGEIGLARGGKLPGFGGGDRIRALLEAGEFVVRKEAVRKFGAGFFAALNHLKLPDWRPQLKAKLGGLIPPIPLPEIAFQTGGMVPGDLKVKELGQVDLNLGNQRFPVFSETNVIEQLKTAIQREKLVRS